MKYFLIVSSLCLLLFSACSPRIGTKVLKSYPALDIDAQVAVYTPSQPIPDGTEALGTVTVADGGATLRCDSLTMITYVQTEAKKIGGNAVLITEYRRPSLFGSNCHQFKGTIAFQSSLGVEYKWNYNQQHTE